MDKWLTVRATGQILGVHENTVRNLERTGKIRGRRNHLNYRVFTLQEVLRVKAERERLSDTR